MLPPGRTPFKIGISRAQSEREEGTITKGIEPFTSQVPSGGYLALAVACMSPSALLQISGCKRESLFIGRLAPSILIMGVYNKGW